jgi:nucleoside diphosphate kinase
MKKKDSLSWYENQIEDRIVNNNLSNFPKVIFKYYELNGEPFYDSEDIHDDSMIFYEDIIDYVRNKHYREEDFYEGDIIERISQYYWYYLNEINISDTNYNYFSYDQERVEEFTKKMKESSYKYPPIVFDPINKMIIDGVHRVVVLKELGVEKVKSYIGDINAINEEFGTIMDLEELIKLKSTKEKKEDFYRFFTGFGKFELDETLLDEYFTQEYYDIAEDYGGCDVEIAPTQIIIHNEEILKRLEIKIILD